MSGVKERAYTREFRIAAAERVLSGCSVSSVARELGVSATNLYRWRPAISNTVAKSSLRALRGATSS
jgi:transposase-like protein